MKKKITRNEAANELNDAFKEGERVGRLSTTAGDTIPDAPYRVGEYSLWSRYQSNFWRDGYKAGQASRKAEMAALIAEDVKIGVAKAIAELPDCKVEEDAGGTSYDYLNGIVTVKLKDGRRLVKYNGSRDWVEMPKVAEVDPEARTYTVDGEVTLR